MFFVKIDLGILNNHVEKHKMSFMSLTRECNEILLSKKCFYQLIYLNKNIPAICFL